MGFEQTATASTDEDTAAIRQLVADAVTYQSDPDPFIALHTPDAIIVNLAGRRVLGRDTIHQAMKQALTTSLASVLTRNEIVDIRFATPDVAIVSCIKHVTDERTTTPQNDPASLPPKGSLTYVVVKEQSAWRIAIAQTTPILNP
jgi:uncharacterized protein (TIGR02246 family)